MKRLPLLLLAMLMVVFPGCKKDNKEEPPPPVPGDYETKEVKVVFPAPGIDPTTCSLLSYSVANNLDGQGRARAAYTKGYPTIAYVFNKDNQLVLAGFVTDSSTTIDAASTAKVLLYYGYRAPLQPYAITELFINRIHEVPGVTAWYEEFTALATANPLVIPNGGFVEPLRKKMEELTRANTVDIHSKKAADITVNDGNVRSGLQVASEELSKFIVVHTYRRRAHAFLYKKSYKDINGNQTNITNYDANGTEYKIDPVSGITGLTGEVGKAVEGKLNESASVTYGPYDMPLEDNESEAAYILRIVGPGFGGNNAEPKTKPEQDKLMQLEVETFALDFMLPIIMEISGNKEAMKNKGINPGDGPTDQFVKWTGDFLKAFPDVYEELKKGDFEGAFWKAISTLWSNAGRDYAKQGLLLALGVQYASASKAGLKVPNVTAGMAEEIFEKPLKILDVVDKILGLTDLLRITANITSSRKMEEWELKARGANVSLSPDESTVIPYLQQKISATIKNYKAPEGQHPFFEWKTTGKYGKLTDTKGHTNLAEFESADKDVFYVSRVSSSSLSNGDNIDFIYVTAFVGSQKIGSDTIKINVQKDKYTIKPDGITLSGKEKANNQVVLYLEKTKGYNAITANDSIDYKVVWTTAGKHGKLSGRDMYDQKSVTQYNDNWAIYECLDDETKEGTETVRAKIYRKSKSQPESAYELYDEDDATIKVNNDEKKRTLVVNVDYFTKILTPAVGNWAAFPGIVFPVDTDAKKYSVRLFNFTGTFVSPPEGKVYEWEAGKMPPTPYNIWPETFDIKGGQQYMVWGRTWCGGACAESSTATWIANYKKGYGSPVAEVTIFLK